MAGERTFLVKFLADTAGLNKGLKDSGTELDGFGTQLTKGFSNVKAFAIAGAAAFGAVAGTIGFAVKAAMEDEAAQKLLQTQLENTFGASELVVTSTERMIGKMQALTGVADTELRSAFGNLVRGTGDLTEANKLLALSVDIAAATGKDLNSVTIALAKASNGQFTALSKLGIPIDDTTKKSKDFDKVLQDLTGTFGGSAVAAADTFGGRVKILKGQFGEIVETLGAALIPYLDKLAKFLTDNVVPAVQRITYVIGEKGLIGGFQQLVFESGSAGPKVISVFKAIAVGIAEAANIAAKAFYITKATLEVAFSPVEAVKDFAKALTSDFIDVDKLKGKFDAVAVGVNHYGTAAGGANKQQIEFLERLKGKGAGEEDPKGGVTKTLDKAKQELKKYTDALKTATSAQKAMKASNESLAKAEQGLTEAKTNVADATAAYNAAIKGGDPLKIAAAQKVLDQSQRGLARAGYSVEQSVFAVADAEKKLASVRKDPESTPQMIREAEIALAEAKLSVSDATDNQAEAATGLNDAQLALNESTNGAIIGGVLFLEVSKKLKDAEDARAEAAQRVADAIDAQTEAIDRFNEALKNVNDLAKEFPKVSAGVANPLAGMAPVAVPEPGSIAGSTGNVMNVTVNAGLGTNGAAVGQELVDYISDFVQIGGRVSSKFLRFGM